MSVQNEYVSWKIRLNNVKWILTLLIVLYHIQLMGEHNFAEERFFLYIKNLGECVVTSFGIISGFLFFYNVNTFCDIKGKMVKRIKTLLIPYVLWNIINSFYVLFRNNALSQLGKQIKNYNWFRNIILWDSSPHFWYIFMLLFWTLLSPILYLFLRNTKLLLILLLTQIVYFIYKGPNILTSRYIYILYTWGGILGLYYPQFFEKISCLNTRRRKILGIICLTLYFFVRLLYNDVNINGILVWCYGFRSILLICGLMCIPLEFFGNKTRYVYSFWLFAVHFYLDDLLSRVVNRHCNLLLLSQFITWIMVVAIGIFGGWILNKFFPHFFAILIGERNNKIARESRIG